MRLGFIGAGNMATAIMSGVIKNGLLTAQEMIASDLSEAGRERLRENLGVEAVSDNRQVVKEADVLILSVKPQFYADVISEIRDDVRKEQIVVTIAPGKTLEWLARQFQKDVKIIRTMPNTPAMVLEGMTGVCHNELVTAEEFAMVRSILECFGKTEQISENLMDVVTSVSGSSPAYVFMFIEAMADAAVSEGMPRAQAYKFAAQAVYGSAKMVLEMDKHPGELKDMVCSPAGTTIEAVRVLEEKGMRSAVIEAMKACTKKSREL